MEFFFGWIIFSVLLGFFASSRGRSWFGYFCLSIVLSPLITFIILLVIPNLKDVALKEERQRRADENAERNRRERHEQSVATIKAVSRGSAGSVADELKKLVGLKNEGLLTETEFQTQRSLLLGIEPPVAQRPVEPPKPMGICPHCEKTIELDSTSCYYCKADFGPGSAWSVKPL